jgi:pimeloyl-ACP methyl ester carboxylesterase
LRLVGEKINACYNNIPEVTKVHIDVGRLNPKLTFVYPDSFNDTFQHYFARVADIRLHYVTGGKGPPVLLLAGFPQSWYAWRRVMPFLARHHKVIALDLPGQGDSDKPLRGYDTKTLAETVHGLMRELQISHYFLAAHDVGAWVAYPYAVLYGNEVGKLALLDAGIPGVTLLETAPLGENSWKSWHFLFNTIPDLPEGLIEGRERFYLNWFLRRKAADPLAFSEADISEYERIFTSPGGLRAGLAYYRAIPQNIADNKILSAKKLKMPCKIVDITSRKRPLDLLVTNSPDFLEE